MQHNFENDIPSWVTPVNIQHEFDCANLLVTAPPSVNGVPFFAKPLSSSNPSPSTYSSNKDRCIHSLSWLLFIRFLHLYRLYGKQLELSSPPKDQVPIGVCIDEEVHRQLVEATTGLATEEEGAPTQFVDTETQQATYLKAAVTNISVLADLLLVDTIPPPHITCWAELTTVVSPPTTTTTTVLYPPLYGEELGNRLQQVGPRKIEVLKKSFYTLVKNELYGLQQLKKEGDLNWDYSGMLEELPHPLKGQLKAAFEELCRCVQQEPTRQDSMEEHMGSICLDFTNQIPILHLQPNCPNTHTMSTVSGIPSTQSSCSAPKKKKGKAKKHVKYDIFRDPTEIFSHCDPKKSAEITKLLCSLYTELFGESTNGAIPTKLSKISGRSNESQLPQSMDCPSTHQSSSTSKNCVVPNAFSEAMQDDTDSLSDWDSSSDGNNDYLSKWLCEEMYGEQYEMLAQHIDAHSNQLKAKADAKEMRKGGWLHEAVLL